MTSYALELRLNGDHLWIVPGLDPENPSDLGELYEAWFDSALTWFRAQFGNEQAYISPGVVHTRNNQGTWYWSATKPLNYFPQFGNAGLGAKLTVKWVKPDHRVAAKLHLAAPYDVTAI